jgi:hypothetical protein
MNMQAERASANLVAYLGVLFKNMAYSSLPVRCAPSTFAQAFYPRLFPGSLRLTFHA